MEITFLSSRCQCSYLLGVLGGGYLKKKKNCMCLYKDPKGNFKRFHWTAWGKKWQLSQYSYFYFGNVTLSLLKAAHYI